MNSTRVKVAADTFRSQGYIQRRRQAHPKEAKWWFLIEMATVTKSFLFRIFRTVFMNYLYNSFIAQHKLPLFIARCIVLTSLSLIPACKSPLNRALRFDSSDQQLQWQDAGGRVMRRMLFKNFTLLLILSIC